MPRLPDFHKYPQEATRHPGACYVAR